jgi:hypothetical protein
MSVQSFLSPLKCHQLFWLFRTIFGYLLTDQSTADYLNCMCCEALDRTDNYYAKNLITQQDTHEIDKKYWRVCKFTDDKISSNKFCHNLVKFQYSHA